MKKLIFFICSVINATTTIDKIVGVTSTQALIKVTAPASSTCTIQVSEDPSLTPLHDDVNPALFANANSESIRTAQVWTSGVNKTRILRVFLRTSDLALDGLWHSRAGANNTLYYISATCDTTATSTFTLGSFAGISPEGPPIKIGSFGNLAFPEFSDFTKPVVEPHSGMKFYSVDPNNWSAAQPITVSTSWLLGGTGWTNLSQLANFGSTGATTGNINPLTILLNVASFNDQLHLGSGYWPYDNFTALILDLYGLGGDATGSNSTVRAAITLDSGQTAFTDYVSVPLTTSNANASIPTSIPAAYFSGWSKRLLRKTWPKQGKVIITNSAVTLTQALIDPFENFEVIGSSQYSNAAYFDTDWPIGTKIHIDNTAPTCINNQCTLAAKPTDALHLTIQEVIPSLVENYYHSAALGVIINKVNANSTVTISARFRLAKSYPSNLGFAGGMSTVSITSSDSVIGYPAIFPSLSVTPRLGPGGLFLVGSSVPMLRFISPFSKGSCISSNSDCPSANGGLGPQSPNFDPIDSTKIYFTGISNAGKNSIYLAQYTGTWTAYPNSYTSTNFNPPLTSEIDISNITSGSNDISSQIIANVSSFDTSKFSANGAQPVGTSGPFFILQNLVSGLQNVTGWIHAFCVNASGPCSGVGTGKWYKSWYLLDSTVGGGATDITSSGLFRYSGVHAITPTFGSSSINGYSFQVAVNPLNFGNSGVFGGGPFTGTITAVYKSGIPSLNTSLPWPIDNTYDNGCPVGLPSWIISHGAVGNQCVTVQGTLPCNAFPATGESPCITGLKIGDFIKNNARDGDSEGMMVITNPTLVVGSIYQWKMQRDGNPSYCTILHDGLGSAGQFQHSNGWSYFMNPRDACTASTVLIDIVNDTGNVYNQNIIRGHGTSLSVAANQISRIASGSQLSDNSFVYNIQSKRAWNAIDQPRDGFTPSSPKFAGYQSNDYITQSYVDAKHPLASEQLKQYAFDLSHADGPIGAEPEYPVQTLGGLNNLVLQSGSTCVYLASLNGTPDIKRQPINAWAGHTMLIDGSGPGSLLSCGTPYYQCYAYFAGECYSGSSQGQYFISLPYIDNLGGPTYAKCWQSQMNLNFPCLFAGPTQIGQARQIYIATGDAASLRQNYLGWLGMGPEQQYVYSSIIPTPDGLYILFTGFVTSGYHTGLMMAKLPDIKLDSINRTSYIPVIVKDKGINVDVRFWYDEYNGKCSPRNEDCFANGAAINESIPFYFASENYSKQSGNITIRIPVLPNHIVYYRVRKNGVEGATQVRIP